MRNHEEDANVTLTDVIHATIHRHPKKSLRWIAEEIGMAPSYLGRAGLPSDADDQAGCNFPLKKLVPLIRATGDFGILDWIEGSVGRVAIPLPAPGAGSDVIYQKLVHVVAEFGDMTRATGEALKDGRVSRREYDEIRTQTMEQIRASLALLAQLEEVAK
jgi:hypothetical protein